MQNFLTHNSLNFYSLVILGVILIQARRLFKINDDFQSKIWLECIYLLLFITMADVISWLYLINSNSSYVILSKICNCVIYFFGVILTIRLALFIDYSVNYYKSSYNSLKKIFFPLIIINGILSILSYFFNIYFTYENNVYQIGNWSVLSVFFIFFPIVFALSKIIILHKDTKQIRPILLLGFILPLIFLIIHRFISLPFTIFFASLTLSVIIYNSLLINNNLNIDFLTGLQNRRGVDKYFSALPHEAQEYLIVLFMDIDGFKAINDKYGHSEGDYVLTILAKILQKSLKISDIAARMGGDEFLVITQSVNRKDYRLLTDKILEEIEKFNLKSNKPYKLDISYGVYITNPNEKIDKVNMIATADSNMYKHKNLKKQERNNIIN